MKKILIAVLLALVTTSPHIVLAQDGGEIDSKAGPLGSGKWLGARDPDTFSDLPILRMDNSGNVAVNVPKSGKSLSLSVLKTPVASVDSTGLTFAAQKAPIYSVYVPTLASTPVAATNYFAPGLNVIPTNAANNAGFLGADATVVPGKSFIITNNSGAAQRIKAAGGATLNGATAGGYISIASLATVECYNQSAANQVCLQPVIPTPAGP